MLVAACGDDTTATQAPATTTTQAPATTTTAGTTAPEETTTTTTERATTTTVVYATLVSAEQLYGIWYDHTPGHGVYVGFDADGQWAVYVHYDPERPVPYHTGTYTLDGDKITMFDDPEGSICAGDIGVWTIGVSESGDEAYFTFGEDSCTESVRSEDWTLRMHSP